MYCLSFSYLTALANCEYYMGQDGGTRCPCPVPGFRGKAFAHLIMWCWLMVCPKWLVSDWDEIFCSSFLQGFVLFGTGDQAQDPPGRCLCLWAWSLGHLQGFIRHGGGGGGGVCPGLPLSCGENHRTLSWLPSRGWVALSLEGVNQSLHLQVEASSVTMCVIFLVTCCLGMASILLRVFASMFIKETGL